MVSVVSGGCRTHAEIGDLSIPRSHGPPRSPAPASSARATHPIEHRRRSIAARARRGSGIARLAARSESPRFRETIVAMANANREPGDPTTVEPTTTDEAPPPDAVATDSATTSTGVFGGVAKGLAWIGDKVRSVVKPK